MNTTGTTTTDSRAGYIEGLRQLATLLENHDDLPLPYTGNYSSLNWIEVTREGSEIRDSAALFARLIPGTITKNVRGDVMDLEGHIAGLKVCFIASRDAVCTRVVTGYHEVVVPATPAQDAVPAQPERVTKVEDIEWVCGSLLSEVSL